MATSTRYIGYCPVCDSHYKVRDDVLVHHGYQRPGVGYIIGDCLGVHKTPHELSPALAQGYLDVCEQRDRELSTALAGKKMETITPEDPRWNAELQSLKISWEGELRAMRSEQKRMRALLDGWQPQPLKQVEEEEAQARAVRDEKRASAREQKQRINALLIAKTQARIDSSVRTQNMGSLASIYESVIHNLGPKLSSAVERVTTDEALRLVDRNHVWQAFGLPVVKPSRDDQAQWDQIGAKLAAMQGYGFRGRRETVEWPRELGEAKRKRSR